MFKNLPSETAWPIWTKHLIEWFLCGSLSEFYRMTPPANQDGHHQPTVLEKWTLWEKCLKIFSETALPNGAKSKIPLTRLNKKKGPVSKFFIKNCEVFFLIISIIKILSVPNFIFGSCRDLSLNVSVLIVDRFREIQRWVTRRSSRINVFCCFQCFLWKNAMYLCRYS